MSTPADAFLDVFRVARCQRRIASAGALFAQRTIRANLKCTGEIAKCQVQCEQGVYGTDCDPDNPASNPGFQACMDATNAVCSAEADQVAAWDGDKQTRIRGACDDLTQEELCGASTEGLNFIALNAGCLALDPTYTCTLDNFLACVGGPLQRALLDQMTALLDPRAPDAIAAANLHASFPDIPVTRKVPGALAAGKLDVWSIAGEAGDEIKVRVKTRDDNGDGTSNLRAVIYLLGTDQTTPVADTTVRTVPCNVPSVCGAMCPVFTRRLPFAGTFYAAIRAVPQNGCTGGSYRLVVTTPSGEVPTLVLDDVDPPNPP